MVSLIETYSRDHNKTGCLILIQLQVLRLRVLVVQALPEMDLLVKGTLYRSARFYSEGIMQET